MYVRLARMVHLAETDLGRRRASPERYKRHLAFHVLPASPALSTCEGGLHANVELGA